jgi:pimeloyl-ACP methyl ester carboxylesterase
MGLRAQGSQLSSSTRALPTGACGIRSSDVFAERYRVLRYDHRGMGKSSMPPGPFASATTSTPSSATSRWSQPS